jgi:hypothetical protein
MSYTSLINNYEELLNKSDKLGKIFLITVGPDVKTYKDFLLLKETKKWYLLSQIDKYVSFCDSNKSLYEYNQLKTKYGFPDKLLMQFSKFNPNVTLGYNTNTYGLNEKEIDKDVMETVYKHRKNRERLLKTLDTKNIDIEKLKTTPNIKEIAKSISENLLDSQKEYIQKIAEKREKGKHLNAKQVAEILNILNARNITKEQLEKMYPKK